MPDGLRSTLPLPLSGLGLKPNEAVILAELVRLLGAKLVDEQEQVRVAPAVADACVKTPDAAAPSSEQLSFGEAA